MPDIEKSVTDFVAEFTGVKRERLTPDSTLFGDLGVDGADGWELIALFGREFQVDLTAFRVDCHFGPEGMPIYWPFLWIWGLVTLPFRKRRSPEQEAGLKPIRIRDLILSVKKRKHGRYDVAGPPRESGSLSQFTSRVVGGYASKSAKYVCAPSTIKSCRSPLLGH